MRPFTLTRIVLLALLACNGSSGTEECFSHCWEYHLEKADIPDTVNPPNYFDGTCQNANGGATIYLPIQQIGYAGKLCIFGAGVQAQHEAFQKVIANKNASNIECLSMSEIDIYETWVGWIATRVKVGCEAHVTCNWTYCDVDPAISGVQACTEASADILCTDYAESIAEALLDLQTGPDVPSYGGTSKAQLDPEDCDWEPHSTDGAFPGAGDDLCDEAEADGGEDADSTGGMIEDPFGDLGNLIACSPSTTCTIQEELIANVVENFQVFYDEGVFLETVNLAGGSVVGAQISGLDSGEDSYALLATHLSFVNGDVITHVNSVPLNSDANIHQVVDTLMQSGTWSVTVRRLKSGFWGTRNYSISLPLSFGGGG